MIVIADTSPIRYLVIVNEIDVLPRLFQRVLIPVEVFEELTNATGNPFCSPRVANDMPGGLKSDHLTPRDQKQFPSLIPAKKRRFVWLSNNKPPLFF